MNAHSRPRRISALVAALALLATLSLGPVAGAQDSENVSVTASVTNTFVSITLCDLTAEFGSGLNSTGATPTGTGSDGDIVTATSEGTQAGQGVFYRWIPSCQAIGEGNFLKIESNTGWVLTKCASENSGTNTSLQIANNDLRWDVDFETTYAGASTTELFPDCAGVVNPGFNAGNLDVPVHYYLQVDDADADGTFVSTTTWSVTT